MDPSISSLTSQGKQSNVLSIMFFAPSLAYRTLFINYKNSCSLLRNRKKNSVTNTYNGACRINSVKNCQAWKYDYRMKVQLQQLVRQTRIFKRLAKKSIKI